MGLTQITNDGADLSAKDESINGVTVGRGAGDVATNTVLGRNALDANTGGAANTAVGDNCMSANTTGNSNTAWVVNL